MRGHRYSVKPGKVPSTFGCLFGAVFVAIGLFVIVPMTSKIGGFGAMFGFAWTAGAVLITLYHAVNAFSDKGVSVMDVESVPMAEEQQVTRDEPEAAERLRELERLRNEKLISEVEFEEKRREILREL